MLDIRLLRLTPNVGTNIKILLRTIGYKDCFGCQGIAAEWDKNGLKWCKENYEDMLSILRERAEKKKLKWSEVGARAVVSGAIWAAERLS